MKNTYSSKMIYNQMLQAIHEIALKAESFNWEDTLTYANWLAQSYYYVSWTTRQLALASAHTAPQKEDSYHWRFLEEAKEEKKHEVLALNDLHNLGYQLSNFPELPHSSFFYQSLNYMIVNEHPISILGFSLTLEGFAAIKAKRFYERVKAHRKENETTFMKVHCELDVEHFKNALPHLESCPNDLLPIVSRSIEMCSSIYQGIFSDITNSQNKLNSTNSNVEFEEAVPI